MSMDLNAPRNGLPAMPHSHEIWAMKEAIKKGMRRGDFTEALGLLEKNKGLARTDADFMREHKESLLFYVIDSEPSVTMMKALLDAGSDPLALDGAGYSALYQLFMKNIPKSGGPNNPALLPMLETMLAHPSCARLDKPLSNAHCYHPIELVMHLMPDQTKVPDAHTQAIFCAVLERTPDELLLQKLRLRYLCSQQKLSEETLLFVLRAMADRGLDLDFFEDKTAHPVVQILALGFHFDVAAGLLAAGSDEGCNAFTRPVPITLKSYLSAMDEKTTAPLYRQADEMLDKEISKARRGEVTPQELLLTPQGRPTWQAQGLAMRGKLSEMFTPEFTERFGGRDAQIGFGLQLYDIFRPACREHFDIAGPRRDAPLARPSECATVRYVRGGAEAVTGVAV